MVGGGGTPVRIINPVLLVAGGRRRFFLATAHLHLLRHHHPSPPLSSHFTSSCPPPPLLSCWCSGSSGARPAGRPTYLFLLKSSAAATAGEGSPHRLTTASIHCHVLKSGFQHDVVVATALINSLGGCSDLDGACDLFDRMPDRDVAAWNAILYCCSRNGSSERTLALFHRMVSSSGGAPPPNPRTLSILVQTCLDTAGNAGRKLGGSIHGYVCRRPETGDTFLYNSLLVYYSRHGDVQVAEKLFERMPNRDVVSWNAMISGYAMNGRAREAMGLFLLLRAEGVVADVVTFETTLQACAQIGYDAIGDGESIHVLLVKLGFPMGTYTMNSLLLMYCKCGSGIEAGQRLFNDMMELRNGVSWNILIAGYLRARDPRMALAQFHHARFIGLELSSHLLSCALQAVKLLGEESMKLVECFHGLVLVLGFSSDGFVSGSLISAYGEFREVAIARQCFDHLVSGRNDVNVLWNAMLSSYVHNGYPMEAVQLFHKMLVEERTVDAVSFVNALSACSRLLDLKSGKAIHGYIVRNKLEQDVFVATSLLEFYIRCGFLSSACWLFSKMPSKSTASWNTMIFGCLEHGFPRATLNLFHLMEQQCEFVLDSTTIVGVIEAVLQRGYVREGIYIHTYTVQLGFGDDEFVVNSLIAMYSKFGDLDRAGMVFDQVSKPSKATWNAMIAEYSHHTLPGQAISIFHLMRLNCVVHDVVTMLSVLPACACLASLTTTTWMHAIICKSGYESDVHVTTSLIDVYAKCGDLTGAQLIFGETNSKTTVTWNSMMCGYGMLGHLKEAEKIFSEMQRSGVEPNVVTFLILLSACSHAGEVEKGVKYFGLMTEAYTLSPTKKHLSCLADLLSRGGFIDRAFEFLENLPADHLERSSWGSLLGACRVEGNVEMALVVAKKFFDLEPLGCGYHVLLSNMLVEFGRWADASAIRKKLDDTDGKKVWGWSRVET